jgi:flagellar protein FlaG
MAMMNLNFSLSQGTSDVTPVGQEKISVQTQNTDAKQSAKEAFASIQHIPDLDRVLRESTRVLQQHQQHLSFTIDESSERMVVSVINSNTSEVIRQFPSEEMLNISHKLQQMIEEYSFAQVGLLVEELS